LLPSCVVKKYCKFNRKDKGILKPVFERKRDRKGMLLPGAQSVRVGVPHEAVAAWIASEYCPSSMIRFRKRYMSTLSGLRRQGIINSSHSSEDDSHNFPATQPQNQQHEGLVASHEKNGYSSRLKQQWTVARTSLNHYPEETRKIIQQKQNARTLTNDIDTQGFTVDLENYDKCRAAIDYERHLGYVDFIGRNGERFSSWMYSHLKKFQVLVASHPQIFNVQDYKNLLAVLHDDYLRFNSSKKREDIIDECENMLLAIRKHLEEIPRPGKLPQPNQIDEIHVQGGEIEANTPKISTSDFRTSFMQRALEAQHLQHGSQSIHPGVNNLQGDQRTELWKSLRKSRLTASAFSKALGFFPGDRVSLWEEKIGVREPFKGNDATKWGTMNESNALLTYEKLTGQKVESCMFKVKKDDVVHDWLGASPDGLVAGLGLLQEQGGKQGEIGLTLGSNSIGPGILEIKCPFNKGRPDLAEPPRRAIWYYMPQIQGLMDVFDREWCILYVWTPMNGSSSFIISRDREYWSTCFDVLAEFWWTHTVPARQLRSSHETKDGDANMNNQDNWLQYKPSEYHQKSDMLKEWSKRIAWNSPGRVFPHIEPV